MLDDTLLDGKIIGRVEPYIYAFSTNSIPNYLKVGETYRHVSIRLNEWKRYFPDLKKEYEIIAKVDDLYFRDFSVHNFLENEKQRKRLQQVDAPHGVYYSREFFKEATKEDVVEAVDAIKKDLYDKTNKYTFYNAETLRAESFTFPRKEVYSPRPNQEATIQKFKQAVYNGRKNLLMYAVMRFGKSFTSMCCAAENNAKLVVVVSAKADVLMEWKKAVESHVRFADYQFYTSLDLKLNPKVVTDRLAENNGAVVFLTLQDLQGEAIKEKHQEIFGQEIDLLIIDETHFGARAEKFGQVLKDKEEIKDISHKHDEYFDIEQAEEKIDKTLKAKVKLHLSGTPYRILMGSEFEEKDIIAFYQFTDIVREQEKWDDEHFDDIENEEINPETDKSYQEFDNPYFAFPQMIRFAFNPNESSIKKLKELREKGHSAALSALLKPLSICKTADNKHKEFEHRQEILDLLEVIDGSQEDDEVLGFLDNDKIKNGKMCRHIVMVLPYCASCDAMEKLIKENSEKFKNLNEYEIINISGVDNQNRYKDTKDVKFKISECEKKDIKTLTLTVNRMLTGTTVKEWDTMIYLKDTSSPQDYDQAIFRLQNQYVNNFKNENGDVIKFNMKPQTLLVDFSPSRVFLLQEKKSGIYNVNVDETGNTKVAERMKEELRVSPIICINKRKIVEVTPTDIMEKVGEYNKTRGVAEETNEISVDFNLSKINEIKRVIENENELGSKAGLTIKASKGEGDDLEFTEVENDENKRDDLSNEDNILPDQSATVEGADKSWEKKFRAYYARILFYSFLTENTVISLNDIVDSASEADNQRIIKNLGLNIDVLNLMNENMNRWKLRELDYKIFNINKLSHDEELSPIERCAVAVNKFGKLGEAEVLTSNKICNDMLNLITDEQLKKVVDSGEKFLDIASKAGEFAVALYQRLQNMGYSNDLIENSIYSIPTSSITYEFTRKIYKVLGLNVENIAEKFTAFDLLECKNERNDKNYLEKVSDLLTQSKSFSEIDLNLNILEGDEKVKFGVVVGNPPYQKNDGGGTGSSASALYDKFVLIGKKLNPDIMSMIMKSNWMTGGKGLTHFRKMILTDRKILAMTDYVQSSQCFEDSQIDGGVCFFVWNKDYDGQCDYTYIMDKGYVSQHKRFLNDYSDDIFIRCFEGLEIARKIQNNNFSSFTNFVYSRNTFKIGGVKEEEYKNENDGNCFSVLRVVKKSRVTQYLSNDTKIANNDLIGKFKVFISKADGAAGFVGLPVKAKVIGEPELGDENSICSETFLVVGPFDTRNEIENVAKYMKTQFFRFLVGLIKQKNMTKETYQLVPVQDFTQNSDINWQTSISELDEQLYEKYNLTQDEINFIKNMIKPL